ncbi:DUF3054 domain-containing protein [Halosegnis sp.]|uniref:DUF3054 domain-containing protein n=1 Tax=Halosegnis sp. TaxID=2864959 RepID=UPI0035D519E0
MHLRPRFDRDWATGATLVGDLLCIGLFVSLGALRHPEAGPLYVRVPEIAAPFILGWLVVGAFVGVFTASELTGTRTVAGRAALAWVGATAVAQTLRATPFVPGGTAPAFVVVSLVVGGTLLVTWRVLASRAFIG